MTDFFIGLSSFIFCHILLVQKIKQIHPINAQIQTPFEIYVEIENILESQINAFDRGIDYIIYILRDLVNFTVEKDRKRGDSQRDT